MNTKYYILILFFAFSFQLSAQCLIKELSITPGACDINGKFYVTINFIHTGTSEKFRVQGNGVNYGLFNYNALPVTIGPLLADCETNYEFVIRDDVNTACTVFKNLGKKCCDDKCFISLDSIRAGTCADNKYPLYVNLKYNAGGQGFDLFNNGKFYGYYKYTDLPLKINDFPSSTTETFNRVVVCANDNPICCDTVDIANPCICNIYKIQGQVVDCDTMTGKFSLKINFKHNLTSDSFLVGGNTTNYGKFAYKDLPITIRNLSFSDDIDYEFLFLDKNDAFCFGSFELGKVTNCNFECNISDVVAKKGECKDGLFYVDISFKAKNTSLDGFIVRGNGVIYGNFEYGESSYTLGPLAADCTRLYEFIVRDKEMEGCSASYHFTEPVCCDTICALSELKITEFCEGNILKAVGINFQHRGTSGKFVLKINNQVIGSFPYSALPLKLTNLNFDLPNVVFRIFDQENEACNLIKEYRFTCVKDGGCNIYDLIAQNKPCNDQGKFYAVLKFKTVSPTSDLFIVKVNGVVWDTLLYGKDSYEIGPLAGDCTTLYKFVVYDIQNTACIDDYAFTEKICCNECKLSNPLVSVLSCLDGKFDLKINFNHFNTLSKFRVKINGVIKGTYNYTDLPVIIEGLSEKQTYEIIIWDVEKETCRFAFVLPAIECPSATEEEAILPEVSIRNDNNMLYLNTSDKGISLSVNIYDMAGKCWYQRQNFGESHLDIGNLPAGMYVLQVMQAQNRRVYKFVKF